MMVRIRANQAPELLSTNRESVLLDICYFLPWDKPSSMREKIDVRPVMKEGFDEYRVRVRSVFPFGVEGSIPFRLGERTLKGIGDQIRVAINIITDRQHRDFAIANSKSVR